jgi:alanine racemase
MEYSIADIATHSGGIIIRNDLPSNFCISRISIDSRTILNGEETLFFALKGLRHNGHHYIGELIEKKVHILVVSEQIYINAGVNVAIIMVQDTLKALQKLTAYHRSRFNYPVIGITGSNGKTIVKEWLHDLLEESLSVVRSPKSYNSQVGVPLSVWNMHHKNDIGIFEAGISLTGEMEKLESIIKPSIGIFTNIGDAHQENFLNIEQKISEKLYLFRSSEKLIYCADHSFLAPLVLQFCLKMGIKPVSWTLKGGEADIIFRVRTEESFSLLTAVWKKNNHSFHLPFTDSSSVENICHCIATLIALNINPENMAPRISQLSPLAMRLEIKKGTHNTLLINDFYNSDVNSLEIALSVLHQQAEKNNLKKIVILSDIRQSGLQPDELYKKVNLLLMNAGVELLIGIGKIIGKMTENFTIPARFYDSTSDFIRYHTKLNIRESVTLIKGARDFRFEDISSALQLKTHQTVFEINLNTLVDNLNNFRSLIKPSTKIMVMVKAFSYGTGDVEIAKILQYHRVDYLAVAVADEGIDLRNAGISIPIVVMNPERHSFQNIIDYQLEPNLYSTELTGDFISLTKLNAIYEFPVHIKIDTGMNRLGFKTADDLYQLISVLKNNPQIKVKSVFSHLVASDDPLFDQFTIQQIKKFEDMSQILHRGLKYSFDRHILNSAGIERFTGNQYEMVRLGIGLYGITTTNLPLKPIGILRSIVSQVKSVPKGETVGYNRAGIINKPVEIAVVPMGYSDGLDRRLGNSKGMVFIKGEFAPIIGNICMDMCMIEVTGLNVKPGDEVEFFGNHISVQQVASTMGTIPYEILTGISQRVKRIYLQE